MRSQGWWSRFSIWRNSIVAVAVLAGAAIQGLDRYKLQPEWTWAHSPLLLFLSIAVPGVLVLGNTVGEVVNQKHTLAGEAKRLNLHKPVIAALVAVSADTGIPITELGVNLFLVSKGTARTLRLGRWALPLARPARLERIERIRLSDFPAASKVVWTEGKGVIGDCWKNARPEHVHWAPLAKRWHGKAISEDQWAKIPEKDKAGFSREDFLTMASKYAEIKAVPIKDGNGAVLGVVALDRVGRAGGRQDKVLTADTVEESLTATAVVLHSVLTHR